MQLPVHQEELSPIVVTKIVSLCRKDTTKGNSTASPKQGLTSLTIGKFFPVSNPSSFLLQIQPTLFAVVLTADHCSAIPEHSRAVTLGFVTHLLPHHTARSGNARTWVGLV